ncbi:MAG: DUF3943 domain-containing protein [Colwellia sp.]
MNIHSNKLKNKKRKPHLLALSLVTAYLFSSQAFAQSLAIQNTPDDLPKTLQQEKTEVVLSPEMSIDNIEEVYREMPTNSRWENLAPTIDFYQSPYQMSLFSPKNGEDSERLWSQTKSVFVYGFGVIGIISLLPEDVSNWDSEQSIFTKWTDNVKDGPVWDRDTVILNYVGHPYFGGAYYQVARKSGYRQWDAFLYSAFMSTFYWEFGIESFAEIPSIQDLVITPVLGWAYGEWAFNTEMELRAEGGDIWGSSMLGSTALFFLDPIDYMSVGINNILGKEFIRSGTGFIDIKEVPYGNTGQTDKQINFNVTIQFGDGGHYSPMRTKRLARRKDPVDTGIIGVSYGMGTTQLDDLWEVAGDTTLEYSVGLYFSPQFSSRATYSKGKFTPNLSTTEINYENYSVDSQYYFNSEKNLRPYLTAGFGETLWAREVETKKFQLNAGVGVHYKLNNNFAVQLDWRLYHSTNMKTSDHNTSLRLVYFLGKGQR